MAEDQGTVSRLVELEVQNQIDKKFEVEFQKHADAFKKSFQNDVDRFRSTVKKVGAAILGVLGIGAISNVSEVLSVPSKIKTAVSTQIEEAVKQKDVAGNYVARLKSLYAESLVYSIEIANADGKSNDEDGDQPEVKRSVTKALFRSNVALSSKPRRQPDRIAA